STVGGWRIALNTSIAYDQTIVVDTMAQTVTRESDGASFAHVLTYDSDLSARLAPGGQEVVFSGRDTTNTASVDVEWSNASNGFEGVSMAVDPVPYVVHGAKHSADVFRQAHYDAMGGAHGISSVGALHVKQTGTPSNQVQVAPGGATILNT